MLDQLSVLKLVTTRLDAAGVPYMITGSIASGHYAHPRFTRDIDLVVELQPDDAERLAALFQQEFDSKLLWARDSRSELQLRDVRQIIGARPELDWSLPSSPRPPSTPSATTSTRRRWPTSRAG